MTPFDMPDYHALIRKIREIDRAGGDSALARLVAADWLQEHGEEERATFARVQVRYAQIHEQDTPERDELSELLLTRFAIRVAAPTPFAPDCPNSMWPGEIHSGVPREWDWLSGWLSAVRCPLAWWLAHGPDLCRRHPMREVGITDGGRVVDISTAFARRLCFEPYPRWVGGGPMPRPEIVTSVISDINYGRPRGSEAEILAEVNAAWLRWAEVEADNSEGRPSHPLSSAAVV